MGESMYLLHGGRVIAPAKPIYFRPFIGGFYNSISKDRLRRPAHLVINIVIFQLVIFIFGGPWKVGISYIQKKTCDHGGDCLASQRARASPPKKVCFRKNLLKGPMCQPNPYFFP